MRNGMGYIAVLELEGSLSANLIDACGADGGYEPKALIHCYHLVC